jgi:hypothetical protein
MHLAVRIKAQESIRALRGKVVWRGHDDDWLASDDEILKRRQLTNDEAESANISSHSVMFAERE